MSMLFERTGFEEDLYGGCVSAIGFSVETLEEKPDGLHARGFITGKDYVEHGIEFTDRWLASRPASTGEWSVCADPEYDAFFRDPDTDEVLFTANGAVNRAMKCKIVQWLDEYISGAQSSTGPAEYVGEMYAYTGECVCVQLMLSADHRPFPWSELTNGGQFPKRCFKCSCGNRWHCIEPDSRVWAIVPDPRAWEHLVKYNGEAAVKVTCASGAYVVLEQTMVDNGFVPLPH